MSAATLDLRLKAFHLPSFLNYYQSVCIFGNPGVGKTHTMAAIGHELETKRLS